LTDWLPRAAVFVFPRVPTSPSVPAVWSPGFHQSQVEIQRQVKVLDLVAHPQATMSRSLARPRATPPIISILFNRGSPVSRNFWAGTLARTRERYVVADCPRPRGASIGDAALFRRPAPDSREGPPSSFRSQPRLYREQVYWEEYASSWYSKATGCGTRGPLAQHLAEALRV
jgi:hypothetical protein